MWSSCPRATSSSRRNSRSTSRVMPPRPTALHRRASPRARPRQTHLRVTSVVCTLGWMPGGAHGTEGRARPRRGRRRFAITSALTNPSQGGGVSTARTVPASRRCGLRVLSDCPEPAAPRTRRRVLPGSGARGCGCPGLSLPPLTTPLSGAGYHAWLRPRAPIQLHWPKTDV